MLWVHVLATWSNCKLIKIIGNYCYEYVFACLQLRIIISILIVLYLLDRHVTFIAKQQMVTTELKETHVIASWS